MIKEIISDESFAIETSRLHITPVRKEEASHYLREFDLEVTRYQYAQPFSSIENVKELVGQFEEARQQGRHLISSIYDKAGKFVGSVEFYHLDTNQPEVGIWICRSEWRKGYAYEVLRGMMKFFSTHMKIESFIYEADQRNEASLRLSQKLRGIKTGYHEVQSDAGCVLKLAQYKIGHVDEL